MGGVAKKEHQRVRDELEVVTADLNAKIIENGEATACRRVCVRLGVAACDQPAL